jgi:hypothetical protein
MNPRTEYKFNWFFRLVFLCIGFFAIFIGFTIDGIRLFGKTTTKGAFNPIKVGIYKTMMDKNQRYRWKVKYEFFIDGEKYIGSKFFRGGPDEIKYKKEIGYLPIFPKINWLETDEPKGMHLILFFIIGQFIIWFGFRKKLIYGHDIDSKINGIYFVNTGILPVNGLNPLEYLSFLFKEFRVGIFRLFSFKLIFVLVYLFFVWFIILWAKSNSSYENFAVILSFFTYAQAGFHGSLFNIAGGIIGKIFLISYLIFPVIDAKIETNYFRGYPAKLYNLYGAVSSFGSFIIGFGIALLLFLFMSSNLTVEDSLIGLVMFLICFKAQKNLNNPIVGFINSFANGKPKNENAARMSLVGASLGFLFAFIIMWTDFVAYYNYLISIILTSFGFLILLFSFLLKKRNISGVSI